ncbi:MAG: metallophosphatase family protein [Nannocystaceae bacterium]|nr:metallophosphatase family protein [Nannocystaceae bacterium]
MRRVHDRIATRDDGGLRLAVVADTHGAPHRALDQRLAALRPDAILHAGDIGDVAVLAALQRHAPLFAVRGNIDAREQPDVRVLELVDGDRVRLRIALLHIALAGVRLRADAARIAVGESADLVICGHSHIPLVARDRGVAIFNPGSCGPRRFQLPILFGTLELTRDAVRVRHVDCESGQPWAPPAS